MGTRGGKRAGAGRKKGIASIKAEEARKYLNERVASEIEEILAGQIELAKGAYSEVETDEGFRRIYRRLPDSKAAAYLINQTIGRPTETVDMNVRSQFSLVELASQSEKLIPPCGSFGLHMSQVEDDEASERMPLTPAERAAFKVRNPELKATLDTLSW